jgi:hypothetical protein
MLVQQVRQARQELLVQLVQQEQLVQLVQPVVDWVWILLAIGIVEPHTASTILFFTMDQHTLVWLAAILEMNPT